MNRGRMPRTTVKRLPPKFAEKMLQLEMDLDYHCNMNTLQQLLEHYSQAIEYYEQMNDPKHMQYQERMQNILMRRDVISVMKGEVPEAPTAPISAQEIKRHKESTDFQRKIRANRLNSALGTNKEERSAHKIVEVTNETALNSSMQVRNDLKSQEQRINARLAERKRQKSQDPGLKRNLSLQDMSLKRSKAQLAVSPTNCESDSAGGSPPAPAFDFEVEFEKIMESHVEKKYDVVQSIKRRYLPQIEDLKSQDSEVVQMVVQNLQVQMEEEIASAVLQLEESKKKLMVALKSKAFA